MTYQQFFQSRGIAMPANYAQFANAEMTAEALAQHEAAYPAPAAPAPAAVPPAAVPPAAATAADPAFMPAATQDNWPVIEQYDDRRCDEEKVAIIPSNKQYPSQRHPGLMQKAAWVLGLRVNGHLIGNKLVFTSAILDANNNVIGYREPTDCDTILISQEPNTGKLGFKLVQSGMAASIQGQKAIKLKPSFNWASLAVDAEAAD